MYYIRIKETKTTHTNKTKNLHISILQNHLQILRQFPHSTIIY